MSHAFHEDLPRYEAGQLLVDGCEECEHRAQSAETGFGLQNLDPERFAIAWKRAADWGRERLDGRTSDAERPMLRLLFSIQVQFERLGVDSALALVASWWDDA